MLKIVCGWASKTWLLPYACWGLHFWPTDAAGQLSFDHSTAPLQLKKLKSVLLILLCVWILFQNASSHSCFRFLLFFRTKHNMGICGVLPFMKLLSDYDHHDHVMWRTLDWLWSSWPHPLMDVEVMYRYMSVVFVVQVYVSCLSLTTSCNRCRTCHDHHDHVLWRTLKCCTGIGQLSLLYRYRSVVCPWPGPVTDVELTMTIMTTSCEGRWNIV